MRRALPLSLLLLAVAHGAAAGEPCGVQLSGFSRDAASPGEEFEMIGRWGDTQGEKIPSINHGGWNRLEVVAWDSARLRVRIPEGLSPGLYKVGVYCNDLSRGSTYSSGWRDFRVTAADLPPPVATAPRREAPSTARPLPPPESRYPSTNPLSTPSLPPPSSAPPAPDRGGFSTLELLAAGGAILILIPLLRGMSETRRTPPRRTVETAEPIAPAFTPAAPGDGDDAYTLESYSDALWTLSIAAPKKLSHRLEVDTRKGRPQLEVAEMGREVAALLELGAEYLDIGFNTDWVAAEFPGESPPEGRTVTQALAHLRRLLELAA